MSDTPMTEGRILNALASSFHWSKNLIIPRCCGLGQFERDLVIVTPAGYLTEIEVKLSLSDWRKDAAKESGGVYKWSPETGGAVVGGVSKFQDVEHGGRHRRFFYCVPLTLWETVKDRLTTEHLPPWAGILTAQPFGSGLAITQKREAANLGGRKLTEVELDGLRSTFYWRFWRHCSGAPLTLDALPVEVE